MKKFVFILMFCLISSSFMHMEPSKVDSSFIDENPTYENVYKVCKMYKLEYPKIVLAQSVLETGHYTSEQCLKHNNLFGLYDSKNKRYYRFDHWAQSVMAYKDKVQYKYKGGDYYQFLDRIGYAQDSLYIRKVKIIKKKLENDILCTVD